MLENLPGVSALFTFKSICNCFIEKLMLNGASPLLLTIGMRLVTQISTTIGDGVTTIFDSLTSDYWCFLPFLHIFPLGIMIDYLLATNKINKKRIWLK